MSQFFLVAFVTAAAIAPIAAQTGVLPDLTALRISGSQVRGDGRLDG